MVMTVVSVHVFCLLLFIEILVLKLECTWESPGEFDQLMIPGSTLIGVGAA